MNTFRLLRTYIEKWSYNRYFFKGQKAMNESRLIFNLPVLSWDRLRYSNIKSKLLNLIYKIGNFLKWYKCLVDLARIMCNLCLLFACELSEKGSQNEIYCDNTLNNNELSELTASSTAAFRALQASTVVVVHPLAAGPPKSKQIQVSTKTFQWRAICSYVHCQWE